MIVSLTERLCGELVNGSGKITESESLNAEENVQILYFVVNKFNTFVAMSYVVLTVCQMKSASLKNSFV